MENFIKLLKKYRRLIKKLNKNSIIEPREMFPYDDLCNICKEIGNVEKEIDKFLKEYKNGNN